MSISISDIRTIAEGGAEALQDWWVEEDFEGDISDAIAAIDDNTFNAREFYDRFRDNFTRDDEAPAADAAPADDAAAAAAQPPPPAEQDEPQGGFFQLLLSGNVSEAFDQIRNPLNILEGLLPAIANFIPGLNLGGLVQTARNFLGMAESSLTSRFADVNGEAAESPTPPAAPEVEVVVTQGPGQGALEGQDGRVEREFAGAVAGANGATDPRPEAAPAETLDS